jgi:hypothetical protein
LAPAFAAVEAGVLASQDVVSESPVHVGVHEEGVEPKMKFLRSKVQNKLERLSLEIFFRLVYYLRAWRKEI